MRKYNIAISCIGSGVGQSVINSLKISKLPIKTIGFGSNVFAYGAYDCDCFDYLPTIYHENYIDLLIEKCIEHKVDLIIPGLDNEALLFSQNADKLKNAGINAMFADTELIAICRDKERMSLELNKIVDVFVKSYNKETLEDDIESGKVIFPFIAKPRGGYASNGIEIIRSVNDLNKINEDHIIQELAVPLENDPNYNFYIQQIDKNINPQVSEISIQIVIAPDGSTMGRMASYNKLNNGVPIEVVPYDNKIVWDVIDDLMPIFLELGLRGPLNIQGRLTKNGLKLFEMNPRFTGITGLRAIMGFNEVEACVKEWLGIDTGNNKLELNSNKFGIRQTADKAISLELNSEVKSLYKHLNTNYTKPRCILISGATGYLGQNLINEIASNSLDIVFALGRSRESLINLFGEKENIKLFTYEDLDNGQLALGIVDIFIHCAFARPYQSYADVAESLKMTIDLFQRVVVHHVPAIINISSQSVYGQDELPPWKEDTKVAPKLPYAQAKYATELSLNAIAKAHPHIRVTSLRMAALSGGQPGMVVKDLPSKLVNQALMNGRLNIKGGNQLLEFMDVRDAVSAILTIVNTSTDIWKPILNIGAGEIKTLKSLALMIVDQVSNNKGQDIEINIEESLDEMAFGLNTDLLLSTFKWKPQYKMEEIINSIIPLLNQVNE